MTERRHYPRTVLLVVAAILLAAVLVVIDLSDVFGVVRERVETTTTTLILERSMTIKETVLETSLQTIERTSISTVKTTKTVVTTIKKSVTVTASTTTKAENWILIMPNFPAPHGSAPGIWRVNDQTAGLFLLMGGNYTTWNANMSVRSIRVVGLGINQSLDVKSLLPNGGALPPPDGDMAVVLNTTLPGARVIVGQLYEVIVEYSREDGTIHRALTWTEEGAWTDELWLVCRDRPPWVP